MLQDVKQDLTLTACKIHIWFYKIRSSIFQDCLSLTNFCKIGSIYNLQDVN